MPYCKDCKQDKTISQFYIRSSGKPRRHCIPCCRLRAKTVWKTDPAKIKATQLRNIPTKEKKREYTQRYRRKRPFYFMARQANYGLTESDKLRPIDIWHVARKQKLICALSGERLTRDNISLDHIIPWASGGSNTSNNLQLVTTRINIAKNKLSVHEFVQMCGQVIKTCKS